MNTQQFLAKQRVKYIWKALRRSDYMTGSAYRDITGETRESFWDYEPTPRNVV